MAGHLTWPAVSDEAACEEISFSLNSESTGRGFFMDLTKNTSIKYSLRSMAQICLLARPGTTQSLRSLDSSYITPKGIPPPPLSIDVLPEGVPFTTKVLIECIVHMTAVLTLIYFSVFF